jgi:hypothetical protein
MSVLDKITDILKDLAKNNMVPSVEFIAGTSLYANMLKAISVESEFDNSLSDDEIIEKVLNLLKDNYVAIEPTIESISDAFANKLKDGCSKLKEIQNDITTLSEDINKSIEQRISLDPKLSKLLSDKDIKHEFDTYSFNMLNYVGSKDELIRSIHNVVIAKDANEINDDYKFNISISKYLNKILLDIVPKNIELTEETKQKVITEVVQLDESLSKEDVSKLLNIITSDIQISRILVNAKKYLSIDSGVNESFFELASYVSLIGPNLLKIEEVLLKNDVSIDIIKDNVLILNSIMEISAYYVIYHRHNTFKDTVLFISGVLNPDMIQRTKDVGISNTDIARYNKYFLKDFSPGKCGIVLQKLVENKEKVDKIFNDAEKEDSIYIASAKSIIIRAAFASILSNYFKGKINTDMYANMYDRADRISRFNMTIEDCLYLAIIQTLYPGTMVELLHKRLGDAYKNLLSENKDVTEVVVNETNIGVYSELISEFLVKHFVEKIVE